MASQEVAEALPSSVLPGSQVEPETVTNSLYQPDERSQNYQKGELQALGALQILNGTIILALSVFLTALQNSYEIFQKFVFFTIYTGYPLLGAIFFISSGSVSIAAERKPTRMLMKNNFGVNIASATIASVGCFFLSANLISDILLLKTCWSSPKTASSRDLCIYMGASSTGLVLLMLILTLLELCITISISVKWCKANFFRRREAISSTPNSVESESHLH
ncbi:membrane-spanning 4-domains subfamily A member 3 [Pteronotus mesoamericanus]|uniref:membrane-spanning 4-domains subfamily A member 3 n=1 Tax=Pteronotus mesoamericanus TaxID=1884717 RepID=UPI0023EADD4F|nr:membrane-spanning 4-domains subfamily A member 3 [Pteronotus parnellii mesoamericanus]